MVSPNMKGSSGRTPPPEQPPHGYQKPHCSCTAHSCPLLWRDHRQHPCADFLCVPELFSHPHPHLTENLYCRTEKQPLVTAIFTRTMTSAQVTSQENYVLWCKNVLFLEHHQRKGTNWVNSIWMFVRILSEYAQEYQHAANAEWGKTPGLCPCLAHEGSGKTGPINTKTQINVHHYFLLYAMWLEKSF